MRIIGIDPGMAIVGYCVADVEMENNEETFNIVTCGSIQTDKNKDNPSRLLEIHEDLKELMDIYKPDIAAIEQLFFFKNAKTIMPVCESRGVIMMTLEMSGVKSYEYTPLVIKQTLTGFGRATKDEVKEMVEILLKNQDIPKLDDTVDAIAIAICHMRNIL